MKHIEIPQLKLTYNLPERLSECLEDEYIAISHLAFLFLTKKIGYDQFKISAIMSLMNIHLDKKHQKDEDIIVSLMQLGEMMSSFFIQEGDNMKLDLDYVDIKIEKIQIGFRRYYAPEPMYTDMTYGEFCEALRFFNQFNKNQEIEDLYYLISVLYRRKRKGKREIYKTETLEKRAKFFKKYLSIKLIAGIYFQFLSFMQYLPTAEIDWDGRTIDFKVLYDSDEATSEEDEELPGIGMEAIVFSLAENGALGNAEKVRETNFWEVMLLLYQQRKKYLEEKKRYDDHNKSN